MKLLWSLFGALSEGLKDDAALQMQIAADGKMDLVSDKHLVFDDDSSEHASSDTPVACRTVASDCRITESFRSGNKRLGTGSKVVQEYNKQSKPRAVQEYNQENPVLNEEAAEALAAVLDSCEAMCTSDSECKNFYFLKNRATGEEECWFYETAEDTVAYIEDKQARALAHETSKWNLCIWQPESKFVGKGLALCNPKVSRTPAEEAAELAVRKAAEEAKRAAKEAKLQAGIAKKEREREEKAEAERQQFNGEVGESIQFKNVLQGRCLSASDGQYGNLTFSNCDDTSNKTLWTKREDGSYESAAHPGRCPRSGDRASCGVDYMALGDCPGFITWSEGTNGLQLKLQKDDKVCLGTWTRASYEWQRYTKPDGSKAYRKEYQGMVISPHYHDNVMTSGTAIGCGLSGHEWARVVTAAPSY